MHTDNEYDFPISCLDDMENGGYAYIGRDCDEYYFLHKFNGEYRIQVYYTIDDSDVSDRMWNDYDAKEEWIEAVRDGDTEESFDDWSSDIDIWDVKDWRDYVDCPYEIAEILAEMDLRDDANDIYSGGCYLDLYDTRGITKDNLEWLYRQMDTEQEFNSGLWADLTKEYHINEIEFLDCESIR